MTVPRALPHLIFCAVCPLLGMGCVDYPDEVAPHGNPYAFLRPDGSGGGGGGDVPPPPSGTSWHKDVRPLVERHCQRCHRADGIGPMALDSYEATAPHREAMVSYVESGFMPPWPFDDACRDLAASRALSADEVAVFADWRSDGFLAGAESDYVAPEPEPAFSPAGEVEVALTRAAYTPRGDETRCFLLSQRVSEDASLDRRGWWVTDIAITPEHHDLVQQVTLYAIAPGAAADLPADEGGYACPFGAGSADEVALLSWVPGQRPLSFDQETALLIPFGTRFVLRVRYRASHLAAPPADATTATLWRYAGRRTPSGGQLRAYAVEASGEMPVEDFLPYTQTILGATPELSAGGATFSLEYLTGPLATCLLQSQRWDERFAETLLLGAGAAAGARLGNQTRLGCTFADGAQDARCRATILGRFPRFDSIQPLGSTCSGVHECLLACSNSTTCLLDCIAWEGEACGQCAREQLFETCAALANPLQHDNLAACASQSCAGLDDDFGAWLSCMLKSCRSQLDIMQATLESELPKGTCNREEEACVYVPSGP